MNSIVTSYCLSGDVVTDSFHVRSELLRRPLDLSVVLVAQASAISVSLAVDCEEGSVVLHIFLTRHTDDGSIGILTAAGDGLFLSLQCSSPSAERHFRFPVVVTGVTMFSAEQCPAAPEDDGLEKGRLSLSRPSGLLVMTMCLKYEVREVREKALSRSSDVEQVALTAESFQ